MFHRLTASALAVAFAVLVSACASVTPARFHRGFTMNGCCLEVIEDKDGNRRQVEVTGTPTETLFTKYLKQSPSSVLCAAFFFHQEETGSGSGPSTADSVNRAAFLALDLPEERAAKVAADLRTCLLKNDLERAEAIFDELAEEAGVQVGIDRYSQNGGFLRYVEYKVSDEGEIVPHGLTRGFHPNGMISEEKFYRDGRPEGEARAYSELGEPLAAPAPVQTGE